MSPVITKKRKTSPSHARLLASIAKAFGAWMAATGLTPENPVKDLGVPRFNGRRRAFSDIEFRKLLGALRDLPRITRKRAIAAVLLAVGSGLRSNEMRQLTMADTHIVTPLSGSWAYIRWDTTKSQYERRVRIAEDAAAAIHDYIASDRPETPGPLFLNSHGEPFTYSGWAKMWEGSATNWNSTASRASTPTACATSGRLLEHGGHDLLAARARGRLVAWLARPVRVHRRDPVRGLQSSPHR